MKKFLFLVGVLVLTALTPVVAPAAAQSDEVVYATGQRFASGVMLWRSDTGLIWVIADNNTVLTFPATTYAALPDVPAFNDGRTQARFGFGKVWGTYAQVRQLIGSPAYPEVGFYMRIRTTASGSTLLTQSNGIVYEISPDQTTWQYNTSEPRPDTYIVHFSTNTPTVETGSAVIVNWAVHGVDEARIEIKSAGVIIGRVPALPTVGSQAVRIPVGTVPGEIEITLYAMRVTYTSAGNEYEDVDDSTLAVEVLEPELYENQPGTTFQRFEHGFMVWRADTQDIYVFYDADTLNGGSFEMYSFSQYATLSNNPYWGVPVGRVRPDNGFGKVWGAHAAVRDRLNWAVGSEQGYLATARMENNVPMSITIPTGQTVLFDPAAGTWHWAD
ncbi:MAG TPA: hypothetical protein VHP83_01240 [Aggregatilineaceae bacterium]|nr:hypothetical protein [Aggregatilineaceae bacterium]